MVRLVESTNVGSTLTEPVAGSYGVGPGADWTWSDAQFFGREVLIDAGARTVLVAIEDSKPVNAEAVATFLAVVGSLRVG